MSASLTSADLGASPPRKYRAACDQCHANKVKCPGGRAPCQRCADSSQSCHYSLAKRIGKPPGSRNKKTLERLRWAREEAQRESSGGTSDAASHGKRVASIDGDSGSDLETQWRPGDDFPDPLRTSTTETSLLPSPLATSPDYSDLSQTIPMPELSFPGGDQDMFPEGHDSCVFQPTDMNLFGLGSAEQQAPWTDSPEDCWNASARPLRVAFSINW